MSAEALPKGWAPRTQEEADKDWAEKVARGITRQTPVACGLCCGLGSAIGPRGKSRFLRTIRCPRCKGTRVEGGDLS